VSADNVGDVLYIPMTHSVCRDPDKLQVLYGVFIYQAVNKIGRKSNVIHSFIWIYVHYEKTDCFIEHKE